MQHEPIDDYIYEVMKSSPEQLQAIRQRVREFKAQAQAQESERQQAVVVNEPPKSDVQPDLSGESEKQAQPEPATFEAHGKTWTRHTPGDPMPCDREANVCVTFRDGDYSKPGLAKHWSWDKSLSDYEWIIGWRYADPADQPKSELEIVIVAANEQAQQESAQPTTSPSWTPAVGDVVSSIPEMALGGQMYWRDLALQLAHVWWKCYKIGASLQHGDLDKDIAFSIVCGRHGGRVFHGYTPENAWYKAEEWLLSPDRENFPAACLTPAQP